jgi:hypothetical protein
MGPLTVDAATKSTTFMVQAWIEVGCTITIVNDIRVPAAGTQAIGGRCTHVTPFRIEQAAPQPWRIEPTQDSPASTAIVTITF